jgi:hypothetical protein
VIHTSSEPRPKSCLLAVGMPVPWTETTNEMAQISGSARWCFAASHDRHDAHGVRAIRRNTLSRNDSTVLVHVECPVTFLYTSELIAANPMQLVGRPKLAKTLPRRRSDWVERDRALILTALLAGC